MNTLSHEWVAVIGAIAGSVITAGGAAALKVVGALGNSRRADVQQLFARIDQLHAELDSLRRTHAEEMEACEDRAMKLQARVEALEAKQ